MSKKSNLLLLITLITLLLANNIFAESPNNPTKKFVLSPSVEQLPPNFTGDDIRALYDNLNKLFPTKKDEFETTKDYLSKLEKNNDSVKDNIYIFSRQIMTGVSYNADEGRLTLPLSECFSESSINMDYDYIDRGLYIAGNSKGASYEVHESTTNWYFLRLSDSNVNSISKEIFSLDLSPAEAKDLIISRNLSFLCVCKLRLADPNIFSYTSYSTHRKEPTVSSPDDSRYNSLYMNVSLSELWAFNKATGKIYQKYKLES